MMLSFQLTMKTYLSTQLLLYMPTDAPVHQPNCSFDIFIPTNCYYLPIVLNIHRSTHLSTHKFSLLISFQLNMHTYLSTHLLVYVPTEPPENKSTCLSWCFFLPAIHEDSATWTTCQQMHPFINLLVHFDAFIPANHKDLTIHSSNGLHIYPFINFLYYFCAFFSANNFFQFFITPVSYTHLRAHETG